MPSTPPPCSYSVPTANHPGPTLNAITPAATDRTQRNERRLAACQRLADLGLEYAEPAQREGLRDLQPRPERRPPPGGMYMPPSPPTYRDTSLADVFATLSRCVRQAILLEARLDSGAFDQPPAVRATPAKPAPKQSPEKPRTLQPGDGTSLEYERLEDEHERVEDDLAADSHRPADEILLEICENLGQALATLPAPTQARPTTPDNGVPAPQPRQPRQPNRPPDKPPPKRSG